MDTIYKIAAIGIAITSAIALISAKLITAAEYSVVEVGTERIDGFSAQSIKNATIGDEGEAYSGEMWLSKDGNVTHPEWFEGDKLINADGTYYLIKAEAAPDYYENGSAEFDPYVIIGDGSDEAENKVEYANGSDVSVNTVDGRDYTYRTLGNNGSMVINLKCSPNETNYLTVQLWGGDTGEGMLWVCDPVSGFMNPTDSEQPHRNGIVDRRNWVELNTLSSTPQYDGGFIYTTYEIPEIYTEGRESVSLRIYSTGGPADYGAIVIKEQTSQSRGIYGAFMEQDPYFEPEEYGITGGGYTNDAQISEVSYDDTKEQLKEAVRSGIDTLREWQIYGGDNYPPYMSGMITRSGSWQAKAAEDEDWKDIYYNESFMLSQNMTPLNMLELAAYAYNNAAELGYDDNEKAEFFDRVIAGIDFLCRAQGSNGGFFSSGGWIGGPYRSEAGGNHLTGFGLRSMGEALLMIWDDLGDEEKSELIDSDADGIEDTARLTAWNAMLESARDYLITLEGGYGHAPNQDMANSEAALKFDAFLIRSGGNTLSRQGRNSVLARCFGDSKNLVLSSYWVSEKGTILENFGSVCGGYSGDYGSIAIVQLSRIAEAASRYFDVNYTGRISTIYDTIDNYYFTGKKSVNGNFYTQLYTEGLTSNRNSYYPGTERYPIDIYAALELQNDTALKVIYDYLNHKDIAYEVDAGALNISNVHYEDGIIDAYRLYDAFDNLIEAFDARDIDEYRYVMEDDSVKSYAWCDETARSVVIKDSGERIYMTLNWRNPMHSLNYYNTPYQSDNQRIQINNLARVHSTNGKYDRYGYAEVYTDNYLTDDWTYINQGSENSCIQALMICRYGDYTVIMNSRGCQGGTARNYGWNEFEAEAELDRACEYTDLVTGKVYTYSGGQWACGAEVMRLGSNSTMVLKKSGLRTYVGYNGAGEAEVTIKNVTSSAEEITVYSADRGNDGSLEGIRAEGLTAEPGISTINIKADSGSEFFVWNANMTPILDKIITIDIDK
ncbi:MAG TPA: hypothetical protein IAA61_09080 [Candidatus Ornithomonoglobus merdipullorum]|uniref:Uncharacterized protein n=1 Tax=Candidatus Ornithomonoglobus merdipullorum TaxID=2840895 RepID=A0A9D1MDB0_9FIRM|nr:hypothetical protein [Candidatus Ornithomonoglobus merdipullorum]